MVNFHLISSNLVTILLIIEKSSKLSKDKSVKVNIKIANKLSAHLFKINSTFIIELGKINNDLNNKLTAEIENFKAHDASYTSEMQRIFSIINNVTIRLDEIKRKFITINATIQV